MQLLFDYRSAKVGDEIGGHNVSGHVHTTAEVMNIEDTENNKCVTFKVPVQNTVTTLLWQRHLCRAMLQHPHSHSLCCVNAPGSDTSAH